MRMSEAQSPKISICIPTFNGANFICRSVHSALEQDFADFEVLIVDNCSTDQTPQLVEALLPQSNGRLRYYRNEHNVGLAENFNRCVQYAKGLYVKFLCVDDMLLPGCLSLMEAELDRHASATLLCGGRIIIDSAGQPIQLKRYSNRRGLVQGKEAIEKCLLGTNLIGEPTAVMFRKRDMTTVFRKDLPQLLDMEMWFRLLEKGDLLNIEAPVCAVRVHEAQVSGVNLRSGNLVSDRIKIFEEYGRHRALQLTPMQRVKHRLAMTYRVWVSRAYLPMEQKQVVLDKYGIRTLYPFMPFVAAVHAFKTALTRGLFFYTLSLNFTDIGAIRSCVSGRVNN